MRFRASSRRLAKKRDTRRFKAHRRKLSSTRRLAKHHGRIAKSTGDGMLAELPSIVEAVLCAVAVQCGMSRRNAEVAEHERVSFRIGINLGDVIAEPGDIYGDGVKSTARLEGLAEPKGIGNRSSFSSCVERQSCTRRRRTRRGPATERR
jgi:class 3 adenylate cyclase